MQIVGFGGFPQGSLLQHVFELAGGQRLLFDRTAAPQHTWELEVDADVTTLSFYPWPPTGLRELALAHDVILVGGGSTANMLAVWRVHGWDRVLREAWQEGVVLCGWSAGMICWFEAGVTDSFGPELAPLHDGLRFLPGSACPHYDGEARRRPVYTDLVANGFPAGIALDDDAGAHYVGAELREVIAARDGARGYWVGSDGEVPLPTRVIAP